MKAVIDTTVFVSYLLSPRGTGTWLLSYWRDRRFELVISPAIFSELIDVVFRPQIASRIAEPRKLALLNRLRWDAVWTPGTADAAGSTPDPKDDMLVSAALASNADVIVTWDQQLLDTGKYRNINFLTPEQFVAILTNLDQEQQG